MERQIVGHSRTLVIDFDPSCLPRVIKEHYHTTLQRAVIVTLNIKLVFKKTLGKDFLFCIHVNLLKFNTENGTSLPSVNNDTSSWMQDWLACNTALAVLVSLFVLCGICWGLF